MDNYKADPVRQTVRERMRFTDRETGDAPSFQHAVHKIYC